MLRLLFQTSPKIFKIHVAPKGRRLRHPTEGYPAIVVSRNFLVAFRWCLPLVGALQLPRLQLVRVPFGEGAQSSSPSPFHHGARQSRQCADGAGAGHRTCSGHNFELLLETRTAPKQKELPPKEFLAQTDGFCFCFEGGEGRRFQCASAGPSPPTPRDPLTTAHVNADMTRSSPNNQHEPRSVYVPAFNMSTVSL